MRPLRPGPDRRARAFAEALQHYRLDLLARGEATPLNDREQMFVRARAMGLRVRPADFVAPLSDPGRGLRPAGGACGAGGV